MAMFYALILLCLSGRALAQIRSRGSCPEIQAMQDFNITKYATGVWHEARRYIVPYHDRIKCVQVDWSIRQNGELIVAIENRTSTLTGIRWRVPQIIRTIDPKNPGNLEVIEVPNTFNVSILGTNYDSYSVQYQCTNDVSTPTYTQHASVYVRNINQYESDLPQIDEIIKKANLDRQKFMKIKHDDCEVQPVSYPPTS